MDDYGDNRLLFHGIIMDDYFPVKPFVSRNPRFSSFVSLGCLARSLASLCQIYRGRLGVTGLGCSVELHGEGGGAGPFAGPEKWR